MPFRYYCSRSHAKEFAKWHFLHCTWIGVRLAIFKRDEYTCQICGKSWDKGQIIKLTKRNVRLLNFADVLDVKGTDLECDHIIPVVQLVEQFEGNTEIRNINSFRDFLSIEEILLSYENLRTLCSKCHSNATIEFAMTRHYESKLRSSAETAKAMFEYYTIGKANKTVSK